MSEPALTAPAAEPPGTARRRGGRRPRPRACSRSHRSGAAVAFVDATIVNIAFPSIEKSFSGTSISSLSWVLNAYNIVFAAFLVAAGRIADLLGRRRIFIFGLELFTAASVLCAVGAVGGRAGRLPDRAGAGGRLPGPRLAGAGAERVPTGAARPRRGAAVGGRGGRRRARPVAGRDPGVGRQLAPGVPGQPADRRGRRSCWPAGSWSRAARRGAGGCPTWRERCCSRWRSPRSCSGS